jgi:hemerythrin superfamily protein
MTDAITLLTDDHRTVTDLFAQAEASPHSPDVINAIVRELSIHDAIEKELLYPAIRTYVNAGKEAADRSIDEHDRIAQALLVLDKAADGSDTQAAALGTLMTMVRAHVNEEETEIFPALRTAVSRTRLEELGQALATAKLIAPTRPHPHAPSSGIGTLAAGVVSAPLDWMKDKLEGR